MNVIWHNHIRAEIILESGMVLKFSLDNSRRPIFAQDATTAASIELAFDILNRGSAKFFPLQF